ncbi:MAG: P-loop NTPase [Clostridiales bacterium]|nr:P-loop NTPase [Clostridiales bacterium]
MYEKRISIFTGHFGSGKTEVSVNYALELAKQGYRTAIVDLDIVNPFFRTADVASILESKGIKVITPVFANTNMEVPSLPPDIYSVFNQKDYRVVIDVGGDDLGAKVLARYHEEIAGDDCEMYFVVNTRRPDTASEEGIRLMLDEIENSSGFKVDWLVNNTNILLETTEKEILEGDIKIRHVSEQLGIPVAFTSGLESVIEDMEARNVKMAGDGSLKLGKLIKLLWE